VKTSSSECRIVLQLSSESSAGCTRPGTESDIRTCRTGRVQAAGTQRAVDSCRLQGFRRLQNALAK